MTFAAPISVFLPPANRMLDPAVAEVIAVDAVGKSQEASWLPGPAFVPNDGPRTA